MNPLTIVKRIQSLNSKEATLGISEEASWHAKYKDSAYVFAGGIPFDLTEGDLLAVFSQYGEIVDVNLVRDKGTGKSKGFAFLAYEDQRSTILAVDNLNGAQILGRTIRVDHVSSYKKKEEEDEETERQKREERGVCRAFQKGECTRGAGCKFSHDEQRAANTGWGHSEDRSSRWGHDKFAGPKKNEKASGNIALDQLPQTKDSSYRARGNGRSLDNHLEQSDSKEGKKLRRHNDNKIESKPRDHERSEERRSVRHYDDEFERKSDTRYRREENKQKRDNVDESDSREAKRLSRNNSESYLRDGRHKRGDKRSAHSRDSPSQR
ncbi:RRM_1 domain-containing protein/zf-CCCH domain-containing protein [Cephalotus follicularis]|uniref:RRM_1 domain-containing protein/zf-CCCH domain-containing protein n=1 Tax=Cephalotus follicularis TaxID=3775 RepID=A0A1Q3BZX0_CEPFO|nr:RRM_1 domain-containing protein/zf-CCCH domain-containing protein [Cephalotus follicularis]